MGQSQDFNQGADKTVSPYGSDEAKQINGIKKGVESIKGSVTPAVVLTRGGKKHINSDILKKPFEELPNFHQQLIDKVGKDFLSHSVAVGPEKANEHLEEVFNKSWEFCSDEHHKPEQQLHLRRYAMTFEFFREGVEHALDAAEGQIDTTVIEKVRNLTEQSIAEFNEDRARLQGNTATPQTQANIENILPPNDIIFH